MPPSGIRSPGHGWRSNTGDIGFSDFWAVILCLILFAKKVDVIIYKNDLGIERAFSFGHRVSLTATVSQVVIGGNELLWAWGRIEA